MALSKSELAEATPGTLHAAGVGTVATGARLRVVLRDRKSFAWSRRTATSVRIGLVGERSLKHG
jgi:hypothetical protein